MLGDYLFEVMITSPCKKNEEMVRVFATCAVNAEQDRRSGDMISRVMLIFDTGTALWGKMIKASST